MPNWPVSYFAITTSSRIAVPILPDFTAFEIVNILEHSGCKALIVSKKLQYKIPEHIFNEMKKPNVTLMKLWEEYKREHPDGIMYTQFCERYRTFKISNKISMHKEHKAGEEIEVDWCGSTVSYADAATGKNREAL